MAIPAQFIDELTARCDIADVVADYVSLTPKGGSLWGLCPFHGERTPSFHVVPEKQIYHCFGCGKGGGVINFVMEIENLPFPDAVRLLAKRAGLEVPEERGSADLRKKRERLLALNKEAARYFHETLRSSGGRAGAEYLFEKRRLSKGTVTRFGLGMAPDGWDNLIRAMGEKGYDKSDLLDVGLVASLARPVEREVYGARCAQAAGISAEAMAQEVKRELSRRLKKEKKQQERRDLSPALQLQPRERAMRYENIRSARAEEGVLRLVLLDPELLKRAERLGPEQFSAPLLARVFTLLRERWSAGLSVSLPALAGELEPGEMSHLTGVLNQPESLQNAEEAMGDYIEIIETEAAKRAGDGRADPLLVMREKYREKKGYGGCIHE